jgi:hypothetical protein
LGAIDQGEQMALTKAQAEAKVTELSALLTQKQTIATEKYARYTEVTEEIVKLDKRIRAYAQVAEEMT